MGERIRSDVVTRASVATLKARAERLAKAWWRASGKRVSAGVIAAGSAREAYAHLSSEWPISGGIRQTDCAAFRALIRKLEARLRKRVREDQKALGGAK